MLSILVLLVLAAGDLSVSLRLRCCRRSWTCLHRMWLFWSESCKCWGAQLQFSDARCRRAIAGIPILSRIRFAHTMQTPDVHCWQAVKSTCKGEITFVYAHQWTLGALPVSKLPKHTNVDEEAAPQAQANQHRAR